MNYYKILNEKERHNGLQYRTGLNVDILPFYPAGDCQPGGIYFAREDILAFLDYGPWIRKVTLPENAQIYNNPGSPVKWKADKVILGRRMKITAKKIKQLIKEGADPKAGNSEALRWASRDGKLDIVKVLIPVSDPKTNDSAPLHWASKNGHLEVVKLLLPVSDPMACNSSALRYASLNGHLGIVKILLPVSDPKALNSEALIFASSNGHIEVVKILIPVSDPKADRSAALR